jgi:hypothetical protein
MLRAALLDDGRSRAAWTEQPERSPEKFCVYCRVANGLFCCPEVTINT